MTGTGTQEDPFVPITLTEFIEAVGTSGAYVELDRDIDAAEDPAYTGELTEAVAWAASTVDGQGHMLRGITMNQQSFIVMVTASTLKNITMIDISLKKGKTNKILVDGVNGKLSIENVKASCKVDCEIGSTAYLTYNCDLTDCAIDIEYIGECTPPTGQDSIFDMTWFTRTTVVIRGLNSQVTTRFLAFCSVYRSAFVIYDSSANINMLYSSKATQYSYICFMGTSSGTINANEAATTCLVASERDISIGLRSGWTRATLAQMRDEAWLASVGFLP